jgi:hypothetical protein
VGIATMGDIRRVASVGLKAVIYFEIVSTLALIVGLVVGNVWPVGAGINVDPKTFDPGLVASYVNQAKSLTITDFLLNIIPTTFVDPFVKGEVLQILFVAVLFGLALCQIGDRAKPLVSILDQVAKALFAMVRVIMYFAPIGAAAAIAFTVGKFGIKTLIDLGQFVFAVFAVCVGFIVVVFGFLLRMCGFRLSRVLAYFKEEILFVFVATSSEAMMPRCMEKLEQLGCSKRGRRFGHAGGLLLQHGRGRDLHVDGGPFHSPRHQHRPFNVSAICHALCNAVHVEGCRRSHRRRICGARRDHPGGRDPAGRRAHAAARRRSLHVGDSCGRQSHQQCRGYAGGGPVDGRHRCCPGDADSGWAKGPSRPES